MSSIYTPYTYLIGWSNLNLWYYGVRFKKDCHPSDLWSKYFTSSKEVAIVRDMYGEPDIIQIRKTFNCPNKAREWENRVLKRMNVIHDDKWLNKTDNIAIQSMPGDLNPSKRKEVREKIKIRNSGIGHWAYGKKAKKETIEKRLQKTQKEWIVINPEGCIIKIKGLKTFCIEQNLCYQSMKMLAKGIQKRLHKGWNCHRT